CPSCLGKGEVQPSILFTDTLREKLDYCINDLGKQNIVMYVHPYVDAYIKKGLFSSLYRTWRSEFSKKFKIVADQSLAYLQYKVIGPDRQEIDLREEKDISSSASKTKRKAKTRSKAADSDSAPDKQPKD
ncbi:MAG: hypothetical protein K2F96_02770, partial [Muribaculaceae bacterium]|nr:hypothetical protein [Muribaculaceae bacterium]